MKFLMEQKYVFFFNQVFKLYHMYSKKYRNGGMCKNIKEFNAFNAKTS